MFFGKVLSTAVLGLTALAGLASAGAVPNRQVAPRQADSETPAAALAIVTDFQTRVNDILPKLVDYDRAGKDTTPVFDALFQTYDQTTKAIQALPPFDGSTTDSEPTPTEQKFIDVSNETLNSVNAVVNILNPNKINDANATILKGKTEESVGALNALLARRPWRIRIIIIIIIRRADSA